MSARPPWVPLAKASAIGFLVFGVAAAVVGGVFLFQAFQPRGGGCFDFRALFGLFGALDLVLVAAPHVAAGWLLLARPWKGVKLLAVVAAVNILLNLGVVAFASREGNDEAVALWGFLAALNAFILAVVRRPEVRSWAAAKAPPAA